MGDTQAMLHQHTPKIKQPHLLSLGGSCCSKKLKSFSSTLKFKLNTSVWVGRHIYFNLWNSHGWSALQWGWLCPESTHLAGGPKTANTPGWPLPSSQVPLPTANGDSKNRTPESGNDPSVCSAYPPFSYPPRSTCPWGGVGDFWVSYTLLSHRQLQNLTVSIKSWCWGAN